MINPINQTRSGKVMKTPSTSQISELSTQIANQFVQLATFAAQTVYAQHAAKAPAKTASPSTIPAKRSRGRPPKTAAEKSNGKKNFNDPLLTAVSAAGKAGITYENLMKMCPPGIRPNHWGAKLSRHATADRIIKRDGRYYSAPGAKFTPSPTPARRRGRPPGSSRQQSGAQPSL